MNTTTKLIPDFKSETIETLLWRPTYYDGEWSQDWVGIDVEDGELLYVECDPDGNWDYTGWGEPATEENYGTEMERLCAETDRAAKDYFSYCATHGHDPLREFLVRRETGRKENYIVYAEKWVGSDEHGMAVTAIRGAASHLNGNKLTTDIGNDVPKHLAEFLYLQKIGDRYCMVGVHSKEDICSGCVGCVGDYKRGIYIKFQLTNTKPRPERLIKQDIRKLAKRALAG